MAHSNWKCPIEIKLKGPFDTLRKNLSQSLQVRVKIDATLVLEGRSCKCETGLTSKTLTV